MVNARHLDKAEGGREIAARIREVREGQGVTQAALARYLSVTNACISNWENGKTVPRSETLPALAAALSTSVDYLLSGSPHGGPDIDLGTNPTISDVILNARKSVAFALQVDLRRVHIVVD